MNTRARDAYSSSLFKILLLFYYSVMRVETALLLYIVVQNKTSASSSVVRVKIKGFIEELNTLKVNLR